MNLAGRHQRDKLGMETDASQRELRRCLAIRLAPSLRRSVCWMTSVVRVYPSLMSESCPWASADSGVIKRPMEIAKLALEDGTVFTGRAFGARGEVDGEVVFNTSMTGNQEILPDPPYDGEIVAMTYAEIGNYGVNAEDAESRRPWVRGFVVRELSRLASNHRASGTLDAYMEEHGVLGIEGVDTRALVRLTR